MSQQQTLPTLPEDRRLSRTETHDLSMIIKDRTKVLKAHAEEQAARCMADFESKLAAEYRFDQDEVWQKATDSVREAVLKAQKDIEQRCTELGIPKSFAPTVSASWHARGENMLSQRRAELRRVASTSIGAMTKAVITKIEKQSLDLRTQVVAMGLYSPDAKLFLESLAPVEDAMQSLDFHEIERKLDHERQARINAGRRLGYGDFET
jgi:hypothetical protein